MLLCAVIRVYTGILPNHRLFPLCLCEDVFHASHDHCPDEALQFVTSIKETDSSCFALSTCFLKSSGPAPIRFPVIKSFCGQLTIVMSLLNVPGLKLFLFMIRLYVQRFSSGEVSAPSGLKASSFEVRLDGFE